MRTPATLLYFLQDKRLQGHLVNVARIYQAKTGSCGRSHRCKVWVVHMVFVARRPFFVNNVGFRNLGYWLRAASACESGKEQVVKVSLTTLLGLSTALVEPFSFHLTTWK